jgi:hypothetical protein
MSPSPASSARPNTASRARPWRNCRRLDPPAVWLIS